MDTVRTWRGRFATGGLPDLADRKPSGRPASFTASQVAALDASALWRDPAAELGRVELDESPTVRTLAFTLRWR